MSPFNRDDLERRLAPLPVGIWIAFASACAQRLLPIFATGAEAWGWQRRPEEFKAMLDACWTLAQNPVDEVARDRVKSADYEGLVRGGDIDDSRGYRLFVYQPIPTLSVALDCARDQTLERAVYAAQKEYDAVFRITDWGLPVPPDWPGMSEEEARAAENERLEQQLRHPLVQTSVHLQRESIDHLAGHRRLNGNFVDSFRMKADADGRILLNLALEIYPRRKG